MAWKNSLYWHLPNLLGKYYIEMVEITSLSDDEAIVEVKISDKVSPNQIALRENKSESVGCCGSETSDHIYDVYNSSHYQRPIWKRRPIMVINLVGAYVSSAKYTRRGVKVVYLGIVGTGGSLWVTGSSRGPVGARVTTQWRKVTLQWPQPPIIQLSHRVEYASREIVGTNQVMNFTSIFRARILIWCENIDPARFHTSIEVRGVKYIYFSGANLLFMTSTSQAFGMPGISSIIQVRVKKP